MTVQSLAIVYGAVIDEVLSKVRSEFVQEGNEPVVDELRALWEEKLLQTGVLDAPNPQEYEEPVKEEQRLSGTGGPGFVGPGAPHVQHLLANPAHILQAPGQLYQQPAHIYLSGQQYLQQNQPLQQPLRNPAAPPNSSLASHPYQPQFATQQNGQDTSGYTVQQPANAYLHQQQAPGQYAYGSGQAQTQQQPVGVDADSRKRKFESSQVPYGANSSAPQQKQERPMTVTQAQAQPQLSKPPQSHLPQPVQAIPQQDGTNDDDDDPASPTEGASLENLSDVEVDDSEIDAKMLPDYILGQYDTVKRIKNRWRCNLNHAVMHLNGQDVVVTKAAGEFTF